MATLSSIRRTLERTTTDPKASPNTRRVARGLLAELEQLQGLATGQTRAQDLEPGQMVQSGHRWYELVRPCPEDSSDWARVWTVRDGRNEVHALVLYNDETGYPTR